MPERHKAAATQTLDQLDAAMRDRLRLLTKNISQAEIARKTGDQ